MTTDATIITPQAVLLLAVLTGLASLAIGRRAGGRTRALDRLARRVDLPTPPSSRDELEREAVDRIRTRVIGASAGAAVVATWALLTRTGLVGDVLWPLLVAGAAIAGLSLAAGVRALGRLATPRPDGPRMARASAPGLSDYVAPVELVGARVVVAIPVIAAASLLVLALVHPDVDTAVVVGSGAALLALLPPLTLLASELGGRRLLDRPQVATSQLELAWRDAIRAQVLRDLVSLPLATGVYTTFGVLSLAADTASDPVVTSVLQGGLGLLAAVVVGLSVLAGRSKPERWFRRRLWPEPVRPTAGAGSS